jgi:predicted dehydrogenase
MAEHNAHTLTTTNKELLSLVEDKLRVGIVGFGKMGLVHTSVLNTLPNVEVVAVCDKSDLVRRFFRKILKHVPILNDIERFSDYGLDAVYVTTPIPYHYSVTRTIFLRKIAENVFVEKTLAACPAEADELCRLAEGSRGISFVGYLRRFYVTFSKAKSLLDEGKIGDVSSFRAYAFSSDFAGVEVDSRESGDRGGVLADLGCHAMDLALWFFGDAKVESAMIRSSVQDNAELLRFELCQNQRIRGVCDVSWCMKDYRMPEVGFVIEGCRGTVSVNDDWVELRQKTGSSSRWYRQDLNDTVPFWLGLPEYYREDNYFVNCILEDCKSEPCFKSASEIDKMIENVKRKLRNGD